VKLVLAILLFAFGLLTLNILNAVVFTVLDSSQIEILGWTIVTSGLYSWAATTLCLRMFD
jgi:hypothetical protein